MEAPSEKAPLFLSVPAVMPTTPVMMSPIVTAAILPLVLLNDTWHDTQEHVECWVVLVVAVAIPVPAPVTPAYPPVVAVVGVVAPHVVAGISRSGCHWSKNKQASNNSARTENPLHLIPPSISALC